MHFKLNAQVILVGCGEVLTFVIFAAQGGFTGDMSARTRGIYIAIMVVLAFIALLASAYERKQARELPQIVNARISARMEYLPCLRKAVGGLVKQTNVMVKDASSMTLEWYKDTYLANSVRYLILRRLIHVCFSSNGATILGLMLDGFIRHNTYYLELKRKDNYLAACPGKVVAADNS
jgi:hypothetical protein